MSPRCFPHLSSFVLPVSAMDLTAQDFAPDHSERSPSVLPQVRTDILHTAPASFATNPPISWFRVSRRSAIDRFRTIWGPYGYGGIYQCVSYTNHCFSVPRETHQYIYKYEGTGNRLATTQKSEVSGIFNVHTYEPDERIQGIQGREKYN